MRCAGKPFWGKPRIGSGSDRLWRYTPYALGTDEAFVLMTGQRGIACTCHASGRDRKEHLCAGQVCFEFCVHLGSCQNMGPFSPPVAPCRPLKGILKRALILNAPPPVLSMNGSHEVLMTAIEKSGHAACHDREPGGCTKRQIYGHPHFYWLFQNTTMLPADRRPTTLLEFLNFNFLFKISCQLAGLWQGRGGTVCK